MPAADVVPTSADATPAALALPRRLAAAAAGPALVGRQAELQELRRRIGLAAQHGPQLVIIGGEPGIGKTRLAAEAAGRAHADGLTVLHGRSDAQADLPYEPWVDAFDELLEQLPLTVIEPIAERHGGALARLLPGLLERVGASATSPPTGGPEHRYALNAALTALLRVAVEQDTAALVVLDDLHWADAGSLLLLRRILGGRPLPVTVVATVRWSDASEDLRGLLVDAEREQRATRIDLAGLDRPAVAELLDRAGLGLGSVDEIHAETAGNPFFVTELLRSATERGAAPGAARLAIPATVRDVVRMRIRRLGADVEHTLALAAVGGHEFDAAVLAAVVGESGELVEARLTAAVRAALVVPVETRPGRYAFAHALVARALEEDLVPADRARAHGALATAFEQAGEPAGLVVAHLLAAGAPEDARLLELLLAAARDARAMGAPAEAVAWAERALGVLGDDASEAARAGVLAELGVAQRDAGLVEFRGTLLEAARLARRSGATEALVQAAIANHRGKYSSLGEPDAERIDAIEAAVAALGSERPADRARLLATLASELTFSGEWDRRARLADEALTLARSADEALELYVLNLRFVTMWTPATLEQRLSDARRGVELAERVGDPAARFRAWQWLSMARAQGGDLRGALDAHAREAQIAGELGHPVLAWTANYDAANLLGLAGRLDEAERAADVALELGLRTQQPDAAGFHANQLGVLRFEQGRLAELVPLLAEITQATPLLAFRALLALGLVHANLPRQAARILRDDASDGFADLPFDAAWDTTLMIYAQVAAELGDAEAARPLHDRLAPWCGQVSSPGVGGWGAVDRAVGLLATVLGDGDAALEHLDRAVDWHDEMGAPVWAARSRLDLAQARLAAGGPGDAAVARSLLEQAAATAGEHAADGLAQTARGLLAVLRVAPPAVAPAPSPQAAGPTYVARREGELWSVGDPEAPIRLRDSKGLRDLARLLAAPGVDVPAVELAAESAGPDAATVHQPGAPRLDEAAKRAYRLRVEDLEDEIEEAERFNDRVRASRARDELDALARELAGAVGLGGRDRLSGATSERARTTVTRRLRHAIDRIAEHDRALGEHLRTAVITGRFCSYRPAQPAPHWHVAP